MEKLAVKPFNSPLGTARGPPIRKSCSTDVSNPSTNYSSKAPLRSSTQPQPGSVQSSGYSLMSSHSVDVRSPLTPGRHDHSRGGLPQGQGQRPSLAAMTSEPSFKFASGDGPGDYYPDSPQDYTQVPRSVSAQQAHDMFRAPQQEQQQRQREQLPQRQQQRQPPHSPHHQAVVQHPYDLQQAAMPDQELSWMETRVGRKLVDADPSRQVLSPRTQQGGQGQRKGASGPNRLAPAPSAPESAFAGLPAHHLQRVFDEDEHWQERGEDVGQQYQQQQQGYDMDHQQSYQSPQQQQLGQRAPAALKPKYGTVAIHGSDIDRFKRPLYARKAGRRGGSKDLSLTDYAVSESDGGGFSSPDLNLDPRLPGRPLPRPGRWNSLSPDTAAMSPGSMPSMSPGQSMLGGGQNNNNLPRAASQDVRLGTSQPEYRRQGCMKVRQMRRADSEVMEKPSYQQVGGRLVEMQLEGGGAGGGVYRTASGPVNPNVMLFVPGEGVEGEEEEAHGAGVSPPHQQQQVSPHQQQHGAMDRLPMPHSHSQPVIGLSPLGRSNNPDSGDIRPGTSLGGRNESNARFGVQGGGRQAPGRAGRAA